jgi:hypothetical protein
MPAKRTTKKATKKTTKRTVKKAKKATPRKTVKAAPKKKAAAKKKVTPKKKAGVKKGDTYECAVCGVRIIVDEVCGCVEEHAFICCMKPMKKRAKKKK